MNNWILILLCLLTLGDLNAQTPKRKTYPNDWHLRSFERDSMYGAAVYDAYEYLQGRTPQRQVVVAIIGVASIFITSVVYPLIKSKLTNSQWETIKNYALAGVQAAEIIIGAGKGEEKLEWVGKYIEAQCKAHGIKIDMDTVQVAIENAWKSLGLDHSTEQEKVA